MLKVLKNDIKQLLQNKPDLLTGDDFVDIFLNYDLSTVLLDSLMPYIKERFETKCHLYSTNKFETKYSVYNIFTAIGKNQHLTLDFCVKYKKELGLSIFLNKNISTENLIKIIDAAPSEYNYDFYYFSQRDDIPMDAVSKYKDKLDWFELLKNNKYPEDFLRKHIDYIKWESLCSYYELSEIFINDFKNLIDWEFSVIHQHLSEKTLRDNAFRFNDREWRALSKYKKLSEQFILDFKDKLDMNLITKYQNLSDEFIDNNKDILKLVNLHLNPNVSKSYILNLELEMKNKQNKSFKHI